MPPHTSTQEFLLPAAPDIVWGLLSSPSLYHQWCQTVTVKSQHDSPISRLQPGSNWLENHHGALFLREWMVVKVLQYNSEDRSMSLCLDDGLNHIQQQLQVAPVSCQAGLCRMTCSIECYQHTGSGPVPCEKLAVMFRKADGRLTSLAAHLQAAHTDIAANTAATPTVTTVSVPLVAV